MERRIDLAEISDGKLYGAEDMVKADCGDCEGCSACCQGMGDSILLDPYDICRLSEGLGKSFEELMKEAVGLKMADGLILPYLKMTGEKEACSFLNSEGRCSIHTFRPGFCRLFPLGRLYENGSFRYFLQAGECQKEPKTKVKLKKWLDTPELSRYEKFVNDWHYFLEAVEHILGDLSNEATAKKINLYILQNFFLQPWSGDFYEEFDRRLAEARRMIGVA